MQEYLYVNLIALAISHSDAQWKPFRKNRFECDMVWTQWNANVIPWKTANMMYMESLLCVKRIPPYALGQAFSPGRKERWPAVLLLPLQGCRPSERKHFWKFFLLSIDDLYDLLIYISLAWLCDAESSAKDVCCVNTVTEYVTLQAHLPDVSLSLGPWVLGREPLCQATAMTMAGAALSTWGA